MARITIEDCITVVGNRFRLVMYGAQRGREIASGMQPAVELDKHIKHEKSAVIALREIAQGHFDEDSLQQAIVRNHRRYSPIEALPEASETAADSSDDSLANDSSGTSDSNDSLAIDNSGTGAVSEAVGEESDEGAVDETVATSTSDEKE